MEIKIDKIVKETLFLTAEWIPYSKGLRNFNYHCSNCKNLADEANDGTYSILTNYCSNCGAKMSNGGKK